ncbi:MAG: hypothetical protein HY319_16230, partial [Armatimonadetes bacterium]|nr:hypothetical protein [Armatimonadota bacterium]
LDACALDPAGLQGLTWLAGELSLRQGSLQPGALRHLEGLTRVTTLRLDGSGPFSLNEVRQLLRSLPGLRNLTLEDRYFRGPRQDLGPATSLLVDWEPYAPALVDPAWQPTTPQERPSRLELPDPTAPPPSAALLRDGVAPAASEQAEVGRGLLLPADSAIWACWSWTRDHILALVDRWLSEDLLALSRGLARAMAALPPTPGRRLALALVEVGGELSAANSLYPAVVELRQLLSSWPVERKLTLHGTEYINWPGSEHVERWRELMSTHEEVFEEVGIRRCWPTDRHEVLGQLDDYLRRHQGTSCDSYRVLEPRVALEQECIQRGHAATSPLLGRELDYAQLAQVEAQTHRRRKFFQALAWYDQACLELSLPVQAEAARALSAELEQEQLRPLWERLVGCLSLLGDRTARPNERFHLLGRRDPEATGHGQWWWRRMLAPLDEPGWAPLEGWRRQEPDYRVLPRPDRPLPELESCVVSDRHEAYLEPLPRLYSGLAGWVSWVVRGLEALGLHRVLENWPLEEGTPQRLCEVACAELSGRYLSVEEHRFLLEINDRVKVPEWEIVEVLCPRPDGTWWPACTPRWPEPQERRGGPDS